MNECMCRHLVECLTNGLISAYLLYIHLCRSMQLGNELSIRSQFQQYIHKNISKEEKIGYGWGQMVTSMEINSKPIYILGFL
jgi:hypothetical protein